MSAKLEVGQEAPDFTALTDAGEELQLSSLRGKRVVLYFYPKDNTPGCTTQACAFRDQFAEVEEKNAVVLGVSPDGVASHVKFKTKYELPFTLLVDDEHTIAESYGAWGEKNMYGRKYMGIFRSQFVIDEQGVLVDVKYKIRPKDSVPRALDALG